MRFNGSIRSYIGSITALLVSLCVHADTSDASISVAASEWPPYAMTQTSPYKGIDIEVGKMLTASMDRNVNYKRCSFKRCLAETEVGSIDIMSGIAKTPDRERYMVYTEPAYSEVRVGFYVRRGESKKIKRYEDLYQYKIGVVVKSKYFDQFDSDKKMEKYAVSEEAILLHMLANKRIDVIIGTSPNIGYQALQLGYANEFEHTVYDPKQVVPIYFAVSKKSPLASSIDTINSVIQKLKNNGTLAKIHDQYR